MRGSPALEVIAGLIRLGASVSFIDPYVDAVRVKGASLARADVEDAGSADVAVVLTAHSEVDHEAIARAAPLVLDTRLAIRSSHPSVHGL
jgi:UDP-N-acetyl-D-glucosamine dehydrogenase